MRCSCGVCDACLKAIDRAVALSHEHKTAVLPFDVEAVASRAVIKEGRTLTSRLWPLVWAAKRGEAVPVPPSLHASLRGWLAHTSTGLRLENGVLSCPKKSAAALLAAAGTRGINLATASKARVAELEALVATGEAFVLAGTSLVFARAVAPPKDGTGPVFVHALLP
jgi:hypothetical protein